jgi:subfamily B ATP-binding cassette protein HlyB/CyaB
LARLHRIAAEPAAVMHQLGRTSSEPWSTDDLLLAARHLGLKGKLSRPSVERLSLTPLPALALLRDGRTVVLAQCDGQRVLLQDPSEQIQGGRPVIEPIAVFTEQWTGELLLVTSRASVAGELAKFDFSWFIPSLVKYRKLFGEVLVISLFLQLFALISPLFFQVVMDKVLVHNGLTTLDVLVIGLLVVVVFESVLTALRTYVIDESGDVVVELASGGTDSIETSVSFALLAEMENLTLTGGASINGVGNSLANALIGNVGSNRLDGGGGADSMTGGAGDDT